MIHNISFNAYYILYSHPIIDKQRLFPKFGVTKSAKMSVLIIDMFFS